LQVFRTSREQLGTARAIPERKKLPEGLDGRHAGVYFQAPEGQKGNSG
jgi:hypothetical protein